MLSAPVGEQSMIDHINSAQNSWTAHANPYFAGTDLKYVKSLCGTILDGKKRITLEQKDDTLFNFEAVPEEFDTRTNWPECAKITGHVRDQASCGSCWAFGSTEAFNDRLCIASKGSFQTLLSVQDTTSCCGLLNCMSFGCGGGQPPAAWRYFVHTGVVSGGDSSDIDSGATCYPYEIPSCAHHVVDPTRPNCTSEGKTPKCQKSCTDAKYGTTFTKDLHKASKAYSLSGESQMKADIAQYGSVTGAFTVYADFPNYKSGVYKHVTGSALGGHAIKIIGWGTENNTPYWLVMNSWNENWGDHGLFKIARGNNECGIESSISAGNVEVSI